LNDGWLSFAGLSRSCPNRSHESVVVIVSGVAVTGRFITSFSDRRITAATVAGTTADFASTGGTAAAVTAATIFDFFIRKAVFCVFIMMITVHFQFFACCFFYHPIRLNGLLKGWIHLITRQNVIGRTDGRQTQRRSRLIVLLLILRVPLLSLLLMLY